MFLGTTGLPALMIPGLALPGLGGRGGFGSGLGGMTGGETSSSMIVLGWSFCLLVASRTMLYWLRGFFKLEWTGLATVRADQVSNLGMADGCGRIW